MTPDQLVTVVCSGAILSIFAIFAIFIYPFREWSEETKRRPRSFISNALFREFWYFIMMPLKGKLIAWNIQPNTITVWGIIFSMASGVAFGMDKFGFGGWFVILAATCDVYDGMLARAKAIKYPSGAFFDSTLDRVGELGMFFGLLWYFRTNDLWFFIVFIVIASSQVVSYARARAEGLGFSGGKGFFQRAERMIVLSIGMSLAPVFDLLIGGDARAIAIKITTGFIAVASFQTAWTRTAGLFQEMRAAERVK
ncbi:MAG: CDP-alcohol phosphatidyltransferase family protein [Bdellovibrionales bacterium]|nr:CDP-alcohol phosphatidyltransferase family protein [Bdellovibrionales bacterium]